MPPRDLPAAREPAIARSSLRSVRVRTSRFGGYSVLIGEGALAKLVADLSRGEKGPLPLREKPARVAVVSDFRVARLYGRRLKDALIASGLRTDLLSFPGGESHKTRESKARLEDRLARLGFGRDTVIVALGGGVTGDLAGFLAATWQRGVPLVQAPTSLLAMVDASIGGKVAVDHPLAKNLIGAFHAPIAVYTDTATLKTLSEREFRGGLAEAVKCGVIADEGFFREIERRRAAILRREPEAVLRLVTRAVSIKARIVGQDEREHGMRMLLNCGHTLGHALEAAGGYRLRHGEAVSIGLALESRVASLLGILPRSQAQRIESLLSSLGLPTRPSRAGPSTSRVLTASSRDKKARAGRTLYVLPSRIGRHAGGRRFAIPVPEKLVLQVLAERPPGSVVASIDSHSE